MFFDDLISIYIKIYVYEGMKESWQRFSLGLNALAYGILKDK